MITLSAGLAVLGGILTVFSPCVIPILPVIVGRSLQSHRLGSILVLAAVKHDTVTAFVLLVLYGLGAGIPLLAIAYGGRYLSQHLLRLRPYSAVLQRVGGALVVVSAIAILLGWDVQIQLLLAPFFPTLPL